MKYLLLLLTVSFNLSAATDQDFLKQLMRCDLDGLRQSIQSGHDVKKTLVFSPGDLGIHPLQVFEEVRCFDITGSIYAADTFNKTRRNEITKLLLDNGAVDPEDLEIEHTSEESRFLDDIDQCQTEKVKENVAKFDLEKIGALPVAFNARCADEKKSLEVIQILYESGANANKLYKLDYQQGGYAPAWFFALDGSRRANRYYFSRLVYALKELNVDPNGINSKGCNVLFDLDLDPSEIETVVKLGVHLHHRCFNGDSVLLNAVIMSDKGYTNYEKIFDYLFKTNVDITASSDEYSSILEYMTMGIPYNSEEDLSMLFSEMDTWIAKNPEILNSQNELQKSTWAMNSMKQFCPNIEYVDSSFLVYRVPKDSPGRITFHNTQRELPGHNLAYNWFKNVLKNNRLNPSLKDIFGNDLLTYSLHFCPSEITQILVDKGFTTTAKAVESFESVVRLDSYKEVYAYRPFNNDEKNAAILAELLNVSATSFKVDRNKLSNKKLLSFLDGKQVDNSISLKSISQLGFNKYGSISTEVGIGTRMKLVASKNMVMKSIPINLKSNVPVTFTFEGRLIGSWIKRGKPDGGTFDQPLATKGFTGFEFKVNPGNEPSLTITGLNKNPKLNGSVTWGYRNLYVGKAPFKELVVLYEEYTYEDTFINDYETIVFDQKTGFRKTFSPPAEIEDESGDIFLNYTGTVRCDLPICQFFKASLKEKKVEISLDSNISSLNLKSDDRVKVLYNLASSDHQAKRLLLDGILNSNRFDVAPFLPEFIEMPDDGMKAQSNQKILLTLYKLANNNKSNRISFEEFYSKFGPAFYSGDSAFEYSVIKFLTTGKELNSAVSESVKSIAALQRLQLMILQTKMDPYQGNLAKLAKEILTLWPSIKTKFPEHESQLARIYTELSELK